MKKLFLAILLVFCFMGATAYAVDVKHISELLKQGYELKAIEERKDAFINFFYFQKGSS